MKEEDSTAVADAVRKMKAEEGVEERPRGVFSHADREYLWGIKDFDWEQSESNARSRIRERIINGVRDFLHLPGLQDRDREMIFDELAPNEVSGRVSSLLEFVYLGMGRDTDALERIVENAVYNAERAAGDGGTYSGGVSTVEVSIDIDRHPDVEEIHDRLESGEGHRLTNAEVGLLLREGYLDPEDVERLEAPGGLREAENPIPDED